MKRILSLLLALSLCLGPAAPAWADWDEEAGIRDAAALLYELGLFKGVGNHPDGTPNFDLDRAPNRAEAVTLLVRLLGKEDAALQGNWNTPFTDVPVWARPYVGYAYANGLTLGTSPSTFGSTEEVSETQYLTFVLRALGYDSATDFSWDSAWVLTDELGILRGEAVEETGFLRGNAVLISAGALYVPVKGSDKLLLTLIEENLAAAAELEGILPFELEVVTLVNEIRVSHGLKELAVNKKLCEIARLKSEDMFRNDYFDHTSPTYGSPFEMLESFGVTYFSAGENIAYGYRSPRAVVEGWMNSPGHRENILYTSFTQIGVGYDRNGPYWTQLFTG